MNPETTAYLDQVDAAAADAARILESTQKRFALNRIHRPATPWLQRIVTSVTTAPPQVARCKHVRHAHSPQVSFLQVHSRRLECAKCTYRRIMQVKDTKEDRTCDVCRKVMTRGSVNVAETVIGPIVITLGYCTACKRAAVGDDNQ